MKQPSVLAGRFATLVLMQGMLMTFAEAKGKGHIESKLGPTDDKGAQFPVVYKELGKIVKLRCKVEPSGAQVSWFKNGKQMLFEKLPNFRRKKKKAFKKTFGYEILVFNAEQHSSGKYTCIVRPDGKTWEAVETWVLKVGIKRGAGIVLHKDIGTTVTLECNVEPWIRVKWKKGGKRLVLKKHPHVRSVRKISYLWSTSTCSLVFDAQLKDSGEYQCLGNVNGVWKRMKKWSLRVNAVTNLTATSKFVNRRFGWWIVVTWDQHSKHIGYTDSLRAFVIQWRRYPDLEILYDESKVNATENTVQLRVLPDIKCANLSITVYGTMSDGERTNAAKTSLQNVGNCSVTPNLSLASSVSGASERGQSVAVILTSVVMGLVLKLLPHRSKRC